MKLRERVERVVDRLLKVTEESPGEPLDDRPLGQEHEDIEAPVSPRIDPDLDADVSDVMKTHIGFAYNDVESTYMYPGLWLKPPPFWESWHQTLSRSLQQLYGKLDSGFAVRQRTGMLDPNRIRYWQQTTRIYMKRLPDRHIDAGVHVIFSVDASGSMGYFNMPRSSSSRFDDESTLDLPPGTDVDSVTPPFLKDVDAGIAAEISRPGVARNGGLITQLNPIFQLTGNLYKNTAPMKLLEWAKRAYDVLPYRNGKNVAWTKMLVAMGLVYVLGQSLEDIGSDSEVVLWDDIHYDWLKGVDQPFGGKMFYTLGGGGTSPRIAVREAARKLERSRAPGRIFVTLSDGEIVTKPEYTEQVEKLNKLGVVTIFVALGREKSLQRAFPNVDWTDPNVKVLGHRYTIQGTDVRTIMTRLPGLILRIQQQLVENAARMDPGRS